MIKVKLRNAGTVRIHKLQQLCRLYTKSIAEKAACKSNIQQLACWAWMHQSQ